MTGTGGSNDDGPSEVPEVVEPETPSGTGGGSGGSQEYPVGAGGVSTGAGGTPAAGGGSAVGSATACWPELFEVDRIEPALSPEEACALTELESTPEQHVVDGDARRAIVGRWVLCSGDVGVWESPQVGVEFGQNGRWQLLKDEGGSLVGDAEGPAGNYYLLPSGQLELRGRADDEWRVGFMLFDDTFSSLSYDRYPQADARYARVAADPASEAANAFPTSGGRCSLVGTWDTTEDLAPVELWGPGDSTIIIDPRASYSFDAAGRWVGGPLGADLCSTQSMHGTYSLDASGLELVTNVGAGLCDFWFNGGFHVTFDETCAQAQVVPAIWDNCTGGRAYFNDPTTLVRR